MDQIDKKIVSLIENIKCCVGKEEQAEYLTKSRYDAIHIILKSLSNLEGFEIEDVHLYMQVNRHIQFTYGSKDIRKSIVWELNSDFSIAYGEYTCTGWSKDAIFFPNIDQGIDGLKKIISESRIPHLKIFFADSYLNFLQNVYDNVAIILEEYFPMRKIDYDYNLFKRNNYSGRNGNIDYESSSDEDGDYESLEEEVPRKRYPKLIVLNEQSRVIENIDHKYRVLINSKSKMEDVISWDIKDHTIIINIASYFGSNGGNVPFIWIDYMMLAMKEMENKVKMKLKDYFEDKLINDQYSLIVKRVHILDARHYTFSIEFEIIDEKKLKPGGEDVIMAENRFKVISNHLQTRLKI